jgi:hypothetical protein
LGEYRTRSETYLSDGHTKVPLHEYDWRGIPEDAAVQWVCKIVVEKLEEAENTGTFGGSL